MPTCQECGEEADEIVKVKMGKKTLRVCERCADELRDEKEVAQGAERVMQGMLEYKGKS
jgi:ribosome-binding protein aMBF1 (putative translation factor)